jgi:hypothetical protein
MLFGNPEGCKTWEEIIEIAVRGRNPKAEHGWKRRPKPVDALSGKLWRQVRTATSTTWKTRLSEPPSTRR